VSGPVEKVIQVLLKPFGKRPADQQAALETKE
jgi:hypothetical protein